MNEKISFVSIFLLLTCLSIAHAQTIINGKITDFEFNPVSNAYVKIISCQDSNLVYSDITDNNGYYEITANVSAVCEFEIPQKHTMLRNYPNPFNPSTKIYFELSESSLIDISVYDLLGRRIKSIYNGFHNSGIGIMDWYGNNDRGFPVSAGIYFCILKTENITLVHKMLLLDRGSGSFTGNNFSFPKSETKYYEKTNSNYNFNIKVEHESFPDVKLFNISCTTDTTIDLVLFNIKTEIIGSSGGTIEVDGYGIEIPVGSLLNDTEITVTPQNGIGMNEGCVGSVSIEPNNINFEVPASLTIPMPKEWPSDHNPMIYVSFTNDPKEYFNTGICADIVTSLDKSNRNQSIKKAKTLISHTGKYGAVQNCHKGTLEFLINDFSSRGCSNSAVWLNVGSYFPRICLEYITKPSIGHQTLQAFLGTYFENRGGNNLGEPVSLRWPNIVDYVKNKNKHVVVLFSKDSWSQKDNNGFYTNVPHSAIIEMKDGKLKLRNSVAAKPKILNALINKNGKNVLWYPKDGELTAENFDLFRNMKTFEALEKELSDKPELFSDLPKLSERKTRPWTAARFYEANQPNDSNPCIIPISDINNCRVKVYVVGAYDGTNGSYTSEHVTPWVATGSWKDTVFTAGIDEWITSVDHNVGTIEVKTNSNFSEVVSFYAERTITNTNSSGTIIFRCQGNGPLPITYDERKHGEPFVIYSVKNGEIPNVMSEYIYIYSVDNVSESLVGYSTNAESSLAIEFDNYD